MPLGPEIDDDVRRLIARVYLEHSDWKAAAIQVEVNDRLRKDDPGVKTGWPGLSAVQKELAKVRKKRIQSPNPEDQPWSILSVHESALIPPDTLPSVLQAWVYARENLKLAFTIREAKWVARLCYVIEDIDTLTTTALGYARRELIADIRGESADSFQEDLELYAILKNEKISSERITGILSGPKHGWSRDDLAKVVKLIDEARGEIRKREAQHERPHSQEV